NGFNINEKCGATHTETMREAVVAHGADLGIALDGDADRVIMADETGRQVDGDQLMALVGRSWGKSGRLKGGGIVGTVMSNLGLERYLGGLGLSLQRAKVGDRYVIEMMRDGGFNVGGEQSGHLVLNDYITTGDGLIAALQALAVIVETDRPVSEVTRCFEPLPQILKNVRYTKGQAPLESASVKDAIKAGEAELKGAGRVLIRTSGTEPVIRVMAEGEDSTKVTRVVDGIADAIARAAG
ncbi:MAG: phosphoglucosamine mutase, partial [Alphaproteobacteria bacterium]